MILTYTQQYKFYLNLSSMTLATDKYCPLIKPSKLIGDTWVILITKELLSEPLRFNQIKEKIPEITSRTLSSKLKFMVDSGIANKECTENNKNFCEYSLTPMGRDLEKVIQHIEGFGNKWLCEA